MSTAPAPAESVPVDQQPLAIRQPVPPNIVLMLDDSGSMNWNFMPDWSYLKNNDENDAVIDSANNGVYYNPAVTYVAPPLAVPVAATSIAPAATTFPVETDMTSVPEDGFGVVTTAKVNLYTYDGSYDYHECRGGVCDGSAIQYNVSKQVQVQTTIFDQVVRARYRNKCTGNWWNQKCTYVMTETAEQVCSDDYNQNDGTGGYTFTGNDASGECKFNYSNPVTENKTVNFFQYSTGPANGPYVVYYVTADAADCTYAPTPANCVAANDTSGVAAPQGVEVDQNVANWFAYYHTRILMAKSGLMAAFAEMPASYRFGFGSINGNGSSDLPTASGTFGQNDNEIAYVEPFGSGASGTQKSAFWTWVQNENADGGTPLRRSLQAVADYYQHDQPWQSTDPTTNATDYLACRQAYVILTTDGFWNGGTPNNVGDVDDAAGQKITGPNGNQFIYEPRAPFMDSGSGVSDTLADVAMKYWDTDLMPSIPNEVPTNDADPAFWQHMVTFTMGMGFTPSDAANNPITADTVKDLFTWANTSKQPASLSNWGGWPVPSSNSIANVADLVHAAVDGHGGFYSATDPLSFVSGLTSALNRAQERTGTGASLAANSTQLKTGTMAYQAIYHTAVWTGQLEAFAVDPVTGKLAVDASWDASTVMPAAADRSIYTYNPSASTYTAGYVAFKNSGTATPPALSTAELTALGSDAASQANMVNYLRGDNSLDIDNGGTYRNRTTSLGDIVDSQPVYVGAPDPNEFVNESFTGSDAYYAFAVGSTGVGGTFLASTVSNREGVIYVAANDGMLHGFDATTGKEVYAFLPASVITHGAGASAGVNELANASYGQLSMPHQYFNDGQLTVADAYFNSAWHTVLVGTTGRGLAKAIYALDVTNPSDVTLLWERSAWDGKTNSGYIGQMTGKPIVAQVADGQWAVLIGNGYNSANGTAALLQFNLADGTLSVHTTDDVTANGLAAPAVWIGDAANGISTMAYAGDLQGRVWSFQLSNISTNGGGTQTTITATPTSTGVKLFTTPEVSYVSGGTTITEHQPITAGMLVGQDPQTHDLWVFFGTGRYLSASDIQDTSMQSWYGLIVQSTNASLVSNLASQGVGALAQRYIIAQMPGDPNAGILPTRVVTPADTATSMDGKSGWFINLQTPTMNADGSVSGYVDNGERMVGPSQFAGSLLIGTTRIPQASDVCNPSGTGWTMAVDPFTGTNPEPEFFDINGDGKIDSSDMVKVGTKYYAAAGVGFQSLPNNPIFVGGAMLTSFDNGTTSSIMTSGAGGNIKRVSWREMINQ
ncbi:MAG TPA: PilC/PilY family type IV pilus protein [Rhodanobacteraceae bacterium]